MNFKTPLFFLLLLLFGCQEQPEQKQKKELTYFDLKGYFEKESKRLSAASPYLTKTVSVNDSTETQKIRVRDWNKELEIFKDSDINKAAWKGMFNVTSKSGTVYYKSDDEKIPVKELSVFYTNGDNKILQGLQIVISNTNILYESRDTLIYYPDSVYQVKKSQDILLLSKKNYQITGKF